MFQESKELTITTAPRTGKWHALAEAIRRGCVARPIQAFGSMWVGENAACALGAAIEAHFAGRHDAARECPDCGAPAMHGFGPKSLCLLAHLNDDHRWTRERIADWLDQL